MLASAACFGAAAIFIRFSYSLGLSTWQTMSIQSVSSSLLLLMGVLAFSPEVLRISRRQLAQLYLQGLMGLATSVFFFMALEYVPAGVAGLLLYTYPIMVAVGAALAFKEWLVPRQVLFLITGLVGISLTVGVGPGVVEGIAATGVWLGLGAAVSYALFNLYGQHILGQLAPWPVTVFTQWASTTTLLALKPPWIVFHEPLPLLGIIMGVLLATVAGIIPFYLLLKGITYIGASRAALASISEVPVTMLLAFVFLGESMQPVQLAGAFLILGSVFLMYRYQVKTQESPG